MQLEKLLQKNIEIYLFYRDILIEKTYLSKLDRLEKSLDNQKKKMEDIDSYFKKLKEKSGLFYRNIYYLLRKN